MSRKIVTWRDVGPCPCGYRPPKIDSIEGWSAWYDHLSEVHDDLRTRIAAAVLEHQQGQERNR